MFSRKGKNSSKRGPVWSSFPFFIDRLEDRRLLSGSMHSGHVGSTIEFSQAPAAVQAGLDTLATNDGLTAPASTSTQTVYLGNKNGQETYTIDLTSTGTTTALTVNQTGTAVTAPTNSTTTFGAITNTAVTDEITAIASALRLTAPTSTTSVKVSTPASGPAVYTVTLTSSSSTTGRHQRATTISVDANGNPTGNETVPFSTLSTAIQTGLNNAAPTGATALTGTSNVKVTTADGVTLYSATFNATGIRTTVTVNSSGALTSLPSSTTVDFSTITSAAQTELQTLATADGYSGTISTTQTVRQYTEANGDIVYSLSLPVSSTDSSGNSVTVNITIAVDSLGNPTVPPGDDGFGGGFGGPGGGGCGGGGGDGSTFGGSGFFGVSSSQFSVIHRR